MGSGSRVGIYSNELILIVIENLGELSTGFQTKIFAISLTARVVLYGNLNEEKLLICSDRQAANKAPFPQDLKYSQIAVNSSGYSAVCRICGTFTMRVLIPGSPQTQTHGCVRCEFA